MTNSRLLLLLTTAAIYAGCSLSAAANTVLFYDGFDYTPGQKLRGNGEWVGTGVGDPIVVLGGSMHIDGLTRGTGFRLALGPTGQGVEVGLDEPISSELWFSFAFQVFDLASLDSNGVAFAGFQQTGGGGGANLWLRRNGSNFDIGANVSSSDPVSYNPFGGNGWDTAHSYFVIGQYKFNDSSPNNDVVNIWINPQGGPDTPNYSLGPWGSAIQVSGGSDRQHMDAFYLQQGPNGAKIYLDEVRIGDSWAAVTPVPDSFSTAWTGLIVFGALLWHFSRSGRKPAILAGL